MSGFKQWSPVFMATSLPTQPQQLPEQNLFELDFYVDNSIFSVAADSRPVPQETPRPTPAPIKTTTGLMNKICNSLVLSIVA